jgi:hypothetical protein
VGHPDLAVGGDLGEGAATDVQKLRERGQGVVDLPRDVIGSQADEPRGEVGQELLEAQGVVDHRLLPRFPKDPRIAAASRLATMDRRDRTGGRRAGNLNRLSVGINAS